VFAKFHVLHLQSFPTHKLLCAESPNSISQFDTVSIVLLYSVHCDDDNNLIIQLINHLPNGIIENSSVTEISQFHISVKSALCLE